MHDRVERLPQCRPVESSTEMEYTRNVIRAGARIELIQKPQPLLGERERRVELRLFASSYSLLTASCFLLHARTQERQFSSRQLGFWGTCLLTHATRLQSDSSCPPSTREEIILCLQHPPAGERTSAKGPCLASHLAVEYRLDILPAETRVPPPACAGG